jgi:hypothetical protein
VKTFTHDEWLAEAAKRFGPDPRDWHFVCPSCGNIQSIADFEAIGVESPQTVVSFSCIGRWTPGCKNELGSKRRPCNYTLAGLIYLAPVQVETEVGLIQTFDFAPSIALLADERA